MAGNRKEAHMKDDLKVPKDDVIVK